MKIERQFTTAGKDAYAELDFVTTVSEIRNPDGSVVFKLDNVEVPASWSQVGPIGAEPPTGSSSSKKAAALCFCACRSRITPAMRSGRSGLGARSRKSRGASWKAGCCCCCTAPAPKSTAAANRGAALGADIRTS